MKNAIKCLLSVLLVWGGLTAQVSAAVIGTEQALALDARDARLAAVHQALDREDVRQAMIDLGVDPGDAAARVASLSDAELAELEAGIDTLPAGGSILGLIGAVFVVLLILELVGVIDIFNKT